MSFPLEVEPDVAAKIAAKAQAKGVTVDDYLRALLEDETALTTTPTTPEEKARVFREWAASHDPNTPLLSDDAISRETIYEDRG